LKNRWYLVVGGILIAGIVATSFYINLSEKSTQQPEPAIETSKNDSNAYIVVHADKTRFEGMDAAGFLNAVKPTLDSGLADSKEYTTFMFDDGTGIYFPFSDITKGGQYVNCDENGFPESIIGYIDIAGTNVTYEEVSASLSADTSEIYQYVADEYKNDGLKLCFEDDVLYVQMYGVAMSEEEAQNCAVDFCSKLKANGFDGKVSSYQVCVNEAHGFKINSALSNVTVDESVIDSVLEHM